MPKKDGGIRQLYVPNQLIKKIQKQIFDDLQPIYSPRACAFAYVKGRNIKEHAKKHVNKRWILRVDLQDFFPNIHFGRVRGIFKLLGCNEEISTYLAQLCCYEGKLPQGTSTSPLISNILASKMDRQLSEMAKQNQCFYTRYCDDLYFSTNRKLFPQNLAFFDNSSGNRFCQLGEDLKNIIDSNDFIVNEKKVYLSDKSNRQFVTGLIVNEKLNINRKFVRSLRPDLKKLKDNPNYKNEYFEKYNKNLLAKIRGKIEFIGYIRGYEDTLYRKYALELSKLDSSYIFNKRNLSFGDGNLVEIYCEGVTDYLLLKEFLKFFKSNGMFTDLEIKFREDSNFTGGDSQLLDAYKKIQQMNSNLNSHLTIFIFDKDNQIIVKYFEALKNELKGLKYLFLPCPIGYEKKEYCIEHLFKFDDILKVVDEENRRIYLKDEFNAKGFHNNGECIYMRINQKTLIADDEVLSLSNQNNIALSKSKFAELATGKYLKELDLSNFEKLFIEITNLKNEFYTLSH
ncbi:reverse transcriptase domain-containing protein [Acinetobacter soli]|uniref:reverse transcriptase domain-containing protein n=1 Tax=Acinetobacter soli TaxID=487316 RepID=UPI0009D6C51B|nr:reverse transcriptase domain-containing protein [Acinetobacter soli]